MGQQILLHNSKVKKNFSVIHIRRTNVYRLLDTITAKQLVMLLCSQPCLLAVIKIDVCCWDFIALVAD